MKTINKTIPNFPKFTKLSLYHKNAISAVINNFETSDFNFAGLFTWDVNNSVSVSILNSNIVFLTSDYLTHKQFFSIVGNNKIDESIKEIFKYLNNIGLNPELKLVPESVKIHITDNYNITEDNDNFDYIILVKDLVEFKSNKYRGKKNLHNRFISTFGSNITEIELDLHDKNVRNQIINVLDKWKTSKNKNDSEVNDELIAISKALEHYNYLNLKAFGIYINQDLKAFTIFEILPKKVAVIHFDKADINYKGINERMKHSLAKHLSSLDIKYINLEQDLGIIGLRKAKESYHPIKYVKKYTISKI